MADSKSRGKLAIYAENVKGYDLHNVVEGYEAGGCTFANVRTATRRTDP